MSTLRRRRVGAGGSSSSSSSGGGGGGGLIPVLPLQSYDVFLCCSPEDNTDVRHFVDLLYGSLNDMDVITTMLFQSTECYLGGALGNNNYSNSISIPIFSKGFADSTQCLAQVEEMLKCRKDNGLTILPVFYGVSPQDVTNQGGSFQESFDRHQQYRTREKIKAWRDALREVSNIAGFTLINNRQAVELVHRIVNFVLKKLEYHLHGEYSLVVTKHHTEEILPLEQLNQDPDYGISIDSNSIQGAERIGKTSLDKNGYNDLCDRLKRCFVESVQGGGFKSLQQQFILEFLKILPVCLGKGEGEVEEKTRKMRILILLDDMNDPHPLQYQIERQHWIGKGSNYIIIRSRSKETYRNDNLAHLLKQNATTPAAVGVTHHFIEEETYRNNDNGKQDLSDNSFAPRSETENDTNTSDIERLGSIGNNHTQPEAHNSSTKDVYRLIYAFVNVFLEGISLALEICSSPIRPEYALGWMVVSCVTMVLWTAELVYMVRYNYKRKGRRGKGKVSTMQMVAGLFAASQVCSSTFEFVFDSRHFPNPFKFSPSGLIVATVMAMACVIKLWS